MTYHTLLPVWSALRGRFQKTVEGLPEESLNLQISKTTIGDLLYHTAEVEYMFAEWFFGKKSPGELTRPTEGIEEYSRLLKASNEHFLKAMEQLPENDWQKSINSPLGASTPLEAVGRLMYHAGIHSGQISLIKKSGHEQGN